MEPGEATMHWFRQEVSCKGGTPEVQLGFLRYMFPELPKSVAMQVICAPEYDPEMVPFNRGTRRRLFCHQTPTLLNLFAGSQKWRKSSGQVIGWTFAMALICSQMTRLVC